MEYLVQFP